MSVSAIVLQRLETDENQTSTHVCSTTGRHESWIHALLYRYLIIQIVNLWRRSSGQPYVSTRESRKIELRALLQILQESLSFERSTDRMRASMIALTRSLRHCTLLHSNGYVTRCLAFCPMKLAHCKTAFPQIMKTYL